MAKQANKPATPLRNENDAMRAVLQQFVYQYAKLTGFPQIITPFSAVAVNARALLRSLGESA